MQSDRKQRSQTGRVIEFRPRNRHLPARDLPDPARLAAPSAPVADLGKYQRARDEEDYRHRMTVNVLALAFCLVLAVAAVWLIDEITRMRRIQDCVLMGRIGCAPLHVSGQRGP
jgi:hypothetical protein